MKHRLGRWWWDHWLHFIIAEFVIGLTLIAWKNGVT